MEGWNIMKGRYEIGAVCLKALEVITYVIKDKGKPLFTTKDGIFLP